MHNSNKKNLVERIISLMMKYSVPVLIIILLLTVYFAYSMTKINVDTNVFAFTSAAEETRFEITPEVKPSDRLVLRGITDEAPSPDRGEVVEVPYRNKSGLNTNITFDPEAYEPLEVTDNITWHDEGHTWYEDGYVIVFTSERMFEPKVLNTIYDVRAKLADRWEIGSCISPFDYVTVEKKGTRLVIEPIAPVKDGETWDEESAEIFRQRLVSDQMAKNYLYTEDGSTIMIYYRARGLNSEAIEELNAIVNPLRQYGIVALNGGGLISNAVMKYLNKDLITLLVLCFVIILGVFYLSFRSVRGMLVPASLSMIGIIWTLGTMALSGYSLTIVTVLTPCLVLTLGSSYSIHMTSEYYEALAKGEKDKMARHFARISRTIFYAMLTTIAGFLSFLVCRTAMFKEFGVTIAIGVFYCGLLSFTYLPAIFARMKTPTVRKVKQVETGLISRFVKAAASFITGKWILLLIILVLIFCGFMLVKDDIGFDSNYMSYFPKDDQIVIDSMHFARTLGGTDPYYFTIRAPNGEANYFYQSENLKDVYAFENAVLAACPDIVQSFSFSKYVSFLNYVYNGEEGIPDNNGLILFLTRILKMVGNQIGSDILNMLISEDGSEVTLSLRNYDSVEGDIQTVSSARRVEQTLDYYRYMLPEGTESRIWGGASASTSASQIIMEDQNTATIISLILIFIIASFAFRSPGYGLIALVPISVGVMINYIFMWAAGIPFDIVTVGFTSVAMGAGVDDALHFIIRYRMLRKDNKQLTVKEALKLNIQATGRPIILTTISVDAGLIMLLFASYTPIKYFGVLMCVSLTAAMIATLFILPPVIILVDTVWNKLRKSR